MDAAALALIEDYVDMLCYYIPSCCCCSCWFLYYIAKCKTMERHEIAMYTRQQKYSYIKKLHDDNYNCVQRKLQTISENWLYTTVKYPARLESNQRRLQIVYTSPSNGCRVYQPIASVTRTEVFLFVRLLIFCNLCLHAHFSTFPALQLN